MARGVEIPITVEHEFLSAEVGDALRQLAQEQGSRLEIRKGPNACRACRANDDPMKVLTGELHRTAGGRAWTTACHCRVVEVDSSGREHLLTG